MNRKCPVFQVCLTGRINDSAKLFKYTEQTQMRYLRALLGTKHITGGSFNDKTQTNHSATTSVIIRMKCSVQLIMIHQVFLVSDFVLENLLNPAKYHVFVVALNVILHI